MDASLWRRIPPPVRFVAVGGINTLFGYAAYTFFLWIGVHYAGAALFGTMAAVVFNYFTTGRLVFDRAYSTRTILPFLGVYAVAYAINVAALAVLERLGVDAYVAGLILVAPMAVVSFLLMGRFAFKRAHGGR